MTDTNDSVVLPRRLRFASITLILSSLYFAGAVYLVLLFKNPSIPLLILYGVPVVLFPMAAAAVLRRSGRASLLLGIASAWYIAFFAASRVHGYIGYAAAVFLCWFLVEVNRQDRLKKASQQATKQEAVTS